MPEQTSYDYVVVRIVPRVERAEFINAGIILFARTIRFLEARVELDHGRLLALFPHVDIEEIERHLALIPKICVGGTDAGPIGEFPQHERWHWLVSPRSTIIQTSETHSGICLEPSDELGHLMRPSFDNKQLLSWNCAPQFLVKRPFNISCLIRMSETTTVSEVELKAGDTAPDFTAESTDGAKISLHDFRGKSNVVLYFYPEDMTSGCTIEAQNFRDDRDKFATANAVILGVSLDSREKHQQFTEKEHLNFPLLVDSNRAICNAYGVPIDGHQPNRWTFLIGKDGKILRAYHKVDTRMHSAQLQQDLASISGTN